MVKIGKKEKNDELYKAILQLKDASSATISRVNRSLSYGTGAYAKLFDRCKEQQK